MQLPVDIPKVLKAATDINAALETPIAVSVYLDESAPGDVVGLVRAAFASKGAQVRMTVEYLGEGPLRAHEGDDMAVIVAGLRENIGAQAAALRAAGVPVMIVTTLPSLVSDMAEAFGNPIPDGDLVTPVAVPSFIQKTAKQVGEKINGALANVGRKGDASNAKAAEENSAVPEEEPFALDEERAQALELRMGQWVIATCAKKKLAFSLAFPFVRKPLALDSVNTTSAENAAIGFVTFIPGADLPIMTLNQMKMLLQIAAGYGEPMGVARAKELACVVGGAFACRAVARQAVAIVPALGWAIKAAVGYGGTQAMGHAAIEYFEAGGDITGFAHVVERARDEVIEKAAEAEKSPLGQRIVGSVKNAMSQAASSAKNAASARLGQ